jgi:hypothetical protein
VLTQYIQGGDHRQGGLAVSDRDADFLEYVTAHRGRMLRTARLLTCGDAHQAYNLAWDEPTLLKFAGSCHYKR